MKKEKSRAKARSHSQGSRERYLLDIWDEWEKPFPRPDQIRRWFALIEANDHLRAYAQDKNIGHIFTAWVVYDKKGIIPPEVMFKNLRHAIEQWLKSNPPKKTTLRRVSIYRDIADSETGLIPSMIKGKREKELAERHGVSLTNLKKIISELRSEEKSKAANQFGLDLQDLLRKKPIS